MSRIATITFAGLATALAVHAHAAEPPMLPPLPPLVQKAPTVVEEYSSGWYLRGDIGYRMNDTGSASVISGFAPTQTDIDDSYSFGGGAGYKSGWFRADVTVDWSTKTNYQANSSAMTRDYTMKVESASALANLYIDLGTWGGFTPYIGAGAGIGWLRTHDFLSRSAAVTVGLTSEDQFNFAWAYMGGMSVTIAPNLLLDMNYRRIELGDAKTNVFNNSNRFFSYDNGAHEFRVGIRYNLD